MDGITGITAVNAPGIWCISTDGQPYSAFLSEDAAETYLKELQLVKPRENWELEKVPVDPAIEVWHGRQPGENKAVWASLACFDFSTKKVIQFRRRWVFNGQIVEVPKPVSGDKLPRFLWMILDTTFENIYDRKCKGLKKLTTKIITEDGQEVAVIQ